MLLGALGTKCFEMTIQKLSVPKLFELLKSSNLPNHIAANLLLVQFTSLPQTREIIFRTLTQDEATIGVVSRLLSESKSNFLMTDLDGCGSSYPEIGLMDAPVRLLSSVLADLSSEAQEPLLASCLKLELLSGLENSLKHIRTSHHFSLIGLSAALDLLSKLLIVACKVWLLLLSGAQITLG